MKRARRILGFVLIVLAFSFLIYWEIDGRERIETAEVLAAAADIERGSEITSDMVTAVRVPRENLIGGAISASEIGKVNGLTVNRKVLRNGQLSSSDFVTDEFVLGKNESIYPIEKDWIYTRSSALRRGDYAKIYDRKNMELLGTFRVAYVRDANELEVVSTDGRKSDDALERENSSAKISSLEIITDLDHYSVICGRIAEAKEEAEGENAENRLIIVPKGNEK